MSEPLDSLDALRFHNPLITPQGIQLVNDLKQHPHAPRFNHVAGDRLVADNLDAIDAYRASLAVERVPMDKCPSQDMLLRIERTIRQVPLFRQRLSADLDFARDWEQIPTMSREDIAVRPDMLVPDDADLEQLIVYRTAGTTGHALLVPHHPRAAACYQPLLEYAMGLYGIHIDFDPAEVACFLVGAQARTVTYPTVLSAWNGAGFAKLNLREHEWPAAESPARYFAAFSPRFLTGDPISYAEMLRLGVEGRPAAMFSTAVAMSRNLKSRLEQAYSCPVIDLYSLTETGPIACWDPSGDGYRVLPHDIFVESLGPQGRPVPAGQRGEITVTGRRNPFLPLLRYRTGDWGRLEHDTDETGRPVMRIRDLEGRSPVLFRARRWEPSQSCRPLANPARVSVCAARVFAACRPLLHPYGATYSRRDFR